MKNSLLLHIFLALNFFNLVACTPEDKNLNRPNSFNQQGNLSDKGLRVGAYGQPIWALQNFENIGILSQACLVSQGFEVLKSDGKITKSCTIRQNHIGADGGSQGFDQWSILLKLKELNPSEYLIEKANGNLSRGVQTANYRGLRSYINYQDKSFILVRENDNKFHIKLEGSGELGSTNEVIKFIQTGFIEGEIQEQVWNISELNHDLVFLNRDQSFRVSSNAVKLNWIRTDCAEPEGITNALERGKPSADIILASNIAKKISDKGRLEWSQKFQNCSEARSIHSLNFEFLFF
jgi:hypothetical protein